MTPRTRFEAQTHRAAGTVAQRASALRQLTALGFAGMGVMYADQAATVADRLAVLADTYGDDPEVAAIAGGVSRDGG